MRHSLLDFEPENGTLIGWLLLIGVVCLGIIGFFL